jgi:hypothetical protein
VDDKRPGSITEGIGWVGLILAGLGMFWAVGVQTPACTATYGSRFDNGCGAIAVLGLLFGGMVALPALVLLLCGRHVRHWSATLAPLPDPPPLTPINPRSRAADARARERRRAEAGLRPR